MRASLDQLEVFLAVVDSGSFRGAAKRLRRTQSTISYAVAQVEASLDRQLFERTGGRPRLTRAGEDVAARARVILAEVNRLADPRDAGPAPQVRQPLHLVVDTIVAPRVLVPLLEAASARLPRHELIVRVESKFSLLELLGAGEADVALSGSGAAVPAGLTREALRTFALVPVVAAHHPLARARRVDRATLAAFPQIAITERSPTGRRQPFENAVGARTLSVTELSLKLELIRAGVGWGYAPFDGVSSELRARTLVRLRAPPQDVGTLSLIYPSQRGPTALGLLIRDRLAPRPRAGNPRSPTAARGRRRS